MAAINVHAANYQNSSVAGMTGDGLQVGPGTGSITVPGLHTAPLLTPVSDIEGLFSGGSHPEHIISTVGSIVAHPSTDLVRATDSVRGRTGGLIHRLGSTTAPGPAGGAAQIRSNLSKAAVSLRNLFYTRP